MSVLAKVMGLLGAALTLIILYLSVSASGALSGAVAAPGPETSPLRFAVYLGLLLTALGLGLILALASSGGSND